MLYALPLECMYESATVIPHCHVLCAANVSPSACGLDMLAVKSILFILQRLKRKLVHPSRSPWPRLSIRLGLAARTKPHQTRKTGGQCGGIVERSPPRPQEAAEDGDFGPHRLQSHSNHSTETASWPVDWPEPGSVRPPNSPQSSNHSGSAGICLGPNQQRHLGAGPAQAAAATGD